MWFNNFHIHYIINSRSLTIFSDFNKSGREVSPSDHLFLKLYTGRFLQKEEKQIGPLADDPRKIHQLSNLLY